MRAFSTKKYPRRILVQNEMIVSVKVDDRGFVVHKWTRKIVDLKQVYLVVKDNRKIYQLALEFVETPGDKKPFTDVLQFDPATSRNFTQLISSLRKELLNKSQGRAPGQGREREREQSRTSEHADADATSSNSLNPAPYGFTAITSSNRTQSGGSGGGGSKRLAETQAERHLDSGLELEREVGLHLILACFSLHPRPRILTRYVLHLALFTLTPLPRTCIHPSVHPRSTQGEAQMFGYLFTRLWECVTLQRHVT